MIIVPIPISNSSWGIGPSLLYMFGMIGVLIYVIWSGRDKTPPKPSKEELSELRKNKAFALALERNKKKWSGWP